MTETNAQRLEREKKERLLQIQFRATLREWDRIRDGRPDRECPFFKGCLSLRPLRFGPDGLSITESEL